MRTIKDLADELGKSKPAIMQKIDELNLRSRLHKEKNKFFVDDEMENLIKASFSENAQSKTQNNSQSDLQLLREVVSDLREQVKIKDEQIANLQRLLDQSQQLQLVAEQKVMQLEAPQEQPKKWWQKLLG